MEERGWRYEHESGASGSYGRAVRGSTRWRVLVVLALAAGLGLIFSGVTAAAPSDCTITGTSDDDVICSRGGDDVLRGGAGNDLLRGGAGDDSLFGGAGDDTLRGSVGNDVFDGGGGNRFFADGQEQLGPQGAPSGGPGSAGPPGPGISQGPPGVAVGLLGSLSNLLVWDGNGDGMAGVIGFESSEALGGFAISLSTGTGAAVSGDEATIRITAEQAGVATLRDIRSVSWMTDAMSGYMLHLDIIFRKSDGTLDALVFEFAKANPSYCDTTPSGSYPTGVMKTFDGTVGDMIDSNSYAWLNSGDPGPCPANQATYDPDSKNFNWRPLSDWQNLFGNRPVVAFDFEIDNWIEQSIANIREIRINNEPSS